MFFNRSHIAFLLTSTSQVADLLCLSQSPSKLADSSPQLSELWHSYEGKHLCPNICRDRGSQTAGWTEIASPQVRIKVFAVQTGFGKCHKYFLLVNKKHRVRETLATFSQDMLEKCQHKQPFHHP